MLLQSFSEGFLALLPYLLESRNSHASDQEWLVMLLNSHYLLTVPGRFRSLYRSGVTIALIRAVLPTVLPILLAINVHDNLSNISTPKISSTCLTSVLSVAVSSLENILLVSRHVLLGDDKPDRSSLCVYLLNSLSCF